MRHILLVLFLLPLFSADAQDAKKKRTCRIIYVERPEDAPTEAYLFDGKQSHKVLLPSLNFSEVIDLPAGEITVGMSTQSVDAADAFPDGAPTAKIPEQLTDLYLLLYKDPENKVFPIKIKTLNIDNKSLKPGQTLWINLSKHRIAAKMGKEEVFIEPKKITISTAPLSSSGYFLAQFRYQREGQGSYLPIMKKSWWFDATSKNLGFVLDTGAKMPKIFTIRDRR